MNPQSEKSPQSANREENYLASATTSHLGSKQKAGFSPWGMPSSPSPKSSHPNQPDNTTIFCPL